MCNRRRLAALGLAVSAVLFLGGPADSQASREHINVLGVAGLVDSVVVDSITEAVADAEADGAIALILQIDSSGVVVDRDEFDGLVARLLSTDVPIATWVGPAGASARHATAGLLTPADVRGRGPGTDIGPAARGVVLQAPTLGDFVVSLDGATTRAGRLSTAEVEISDSGQPRRKPTVEVRFVEPPLIARLLHITSSPAISYLLLLAGIGLILLELFSLGGGLAGATAAICVVLSSYGLAELPTRPVGLGLLGLAGLAAGIDIQAGTARFWTALSAIALVGGTLLLFGDGLGGPVGLPWLAGVSGTSGFLLLVVRAMPSIVRSRTTAGGLAPPATT